MHDDTIVMLARLVDAGHVRWRDGRVQLHDAINDADRAWLTRHRDAVTAALTPFTDDGTAAAHVVRAFHKTTKVDRGQSDADRYWTAWRPALRPILPDGEQHHATCDGCHRPAGTAARPLFGMRGVDPMLCRDCWDRR